jgi:hypothetical protein
MCIRGTDVAEREKVLLRNAATRPVEVHFPNRVLVLAPREAFELTEANAMCDALERRGVLTRHVIREVVPVAPPEVASTAATAPPGKKKPERTSAARRTPATPSTGPDTPSAKGDSE